LVLVMNKHSSVLLMLVLLLAVTAVGQEVKMPDFPKGVGRSVGISFFEPYFPQLEAIANTLKADSAAMAVITGKADGVKYPRHNDAMNPGLALGRAQALADLMLDRFGVDSVQIQIQAQTVEQQGPQFRAVSIRVQKPAPPPPPTVIEKVQPVIEQPEPPPPEPVYIVDSVKVVSPDNFRLHVGAGMTTSPFGGMPFVSGAVSWNRQVYIEGAFGHAFWSRDFELNNQVLGTKDRMIAGMAIVYPFTDIPVGAVAGWVRIEEISNDFHEYTQLSEGLMIGVRAMPIQYASLTAMYNPSKHRNAEVDISDAKNGQILLQLAVHLTFGE